VRTIIKDALHAVCSQKQQPGLEWSFWCCNLSCCRRQSGVCCITFRLQHYN